MQYIFNRNSNLFIEKKILVYYGSIFNTFKTRIFYCYCYVIVEYSSRLLE